MQTFGSQPTEASPRKSRELPQTPRIRLDRPLLVDLAWLTGIGTATAFFCAYARVHIGVPSHSVLQWLPVVMLCQLFINRSWAALYQSALVGALCCLRLNLAGIALGLVAYSLTGAIVSWAFDHFSVKRSLGWKIWLICPAVGAVANLSRWLLRLLSPHTFRGLHAFGLAGYFIFYLIFGLVSGIIVALAYSLWRSRKAAGQGTV